MPATLASITSITSPAPSGRGTRQAHRRRTAGASSIAKKRESAIGIRRPRPTCSAASTASNARIVRSVRTRLRSPVRGSSSISTGSGGTAEPLLLLGMPPPALANRRRPRTAELLRVLLDLEVVLHRLHAGHGTGHLASLQLLFVGIDEALQLHHTVLRVDVDLARLGRRIVDQRGLHLRGDRTVIDHVTSGALGRARLHFDVVAHF